MKLNSLIFLGHAALTQPRCIIQLPHENSVNP